MRNILFRADSSSTIGTGHIMRDLVLAEQFKDDTIIFATQDLPGNINHKIEEKEYTIENLRSNDLKELNRLIKKLKIDMIIIDHYGIDYDFEKKLKNQNSKLKIFSLDDTYERHYCDILLNHNIYADSLRYKSLVPANCELRCGSQYTLLREEFKSEKRKEQSSSRKQINVFIAMGGTDHTNLNVKILNVLENFPNIHVDVVTTTANQYLPEIQAYVKNKNNVTLHINTNDIAKLMYESNVAIVTPSVTVNEVVFMDIPLIAIKTAENQDEMYKYLKENDYLVLETFNSIELKEKLETLLNRQEVKCVNFVDLSLDEKKMVLEWRNHPNIQKWMFTQEPISLQDHLNYIDSLSSREDRAYFLVKRDSENIGVIDFTNIDHNMKTAELGIYANPAIKGVGRLLMIEIIDYVFNTLHIDTLISEVFEENELALKLYKRCGFKVISVKETNNKNVLHMELKNEHR